MKKTIPSSGAYSADVVFSSKSYSADMRVEAGFCEWGDGNRRASKYDRRCPECRRAS